jgi:uncharacterized Zn-binding protein involved in type VI secretion
MPGVAVCNIDSAGGIIKPGPNVTIFYKGNPVAVVGCEVNGHGSGSHASAVMIQGSSKVFIKGIPIVLAGDLASCGDRATGRPDLTSSS